MTDDQASHVFDRFYRTDSGRSRAGGGASLARFSVELPAES